MFFSGGNFREDEMMFLGWENLEEKEARDKDEELRHECLSDSVSWKSDSQVY